MGPVGTGSDGILPPVPPSAEAVEGNHSCNPRDRAAAIYKAESNMFNWIDKIHISVPIGPHLRQLSLRYRPRKASSVHCLDPKNHITSPQGSCFPSRNLMMTSSSAVLQTTSVASLPVGLYCMSAPFAMYPLISLSMAEK